MAGLALIGAAASLALATPHAPALDTYAFTGVVTGASGPLAGATVRNGAQVTTTDSNGHYRLGQLLPGSYTLRASASCHGASSKTVTVIIPADTVVDFDLGTASC